MNTPVEFTSNLFRDNLDFYNAVVVFVVVVVSVNIAAFVKYNDVIIIALFSKISNNRQTRIYLGLAIWAGACH